jgi:hypothetical protein
VSSSPVWVWSDVVLRGDIAAKALCYGCQTPLVIFGWRRHGSTVWRRERDGAHSMGLVRRPNLHPSGVPRYGPPRRAGHGDARHEHVNIEPVAWMPMRDVDAMYVNCHRCDRAQVVSVADAEAKLAPEGWRPTARRANV